MRGSEDGKEKTIEKNRANRFISCTRVALEGEIL